MSNIIVIPRYTEENPDVPSGIAIWDGFADEMENGGVENPIFAAVNRIYPPSGGDCNGLRGAEIGEIVDISEPDEHGVYSIAFCDGKITTRTAYAGSRETLEITSNTMQDNSINTVAQSIFGFAYSISRESFFGEIPSGIKQFNRHWIQSESHFEWGIGDGDDYVSVEQIDQSLSWLDCVGYYGIVTPDRVGEGNDVRVYGYHELTQYTYGAHVMGRQAFGYPLLLSVISIMLGGFGGGAGQVKPNAMINVLPNSIANVRPNIDKEM